MDVVKVEWFGLSLLEPMTLFTDFLVSVFCVYFGFRIRQKSRKNIATYWSLFFWGLALSTFFAGIAHAFLNYLGYKAHLVARCLSTFGFFFAEMGSYMTLKKKSTRALLVVVSVIKGLAVLWLLIVKNNFEIVKINSMLSLIGIVLFIHMVHFFKGEKHAGKMFLIGIGFGVIAALASGFKFSLHEWFTHHDIGHVMMVGSFYFFFKGVYPEEYLLQPIETQNR